MPIRTVLHMQDRAVVMRDLLHNIGGFDIEYSKHS